MFCWDAISHADLECTEMKITIEHTLLGRIGRVGENNEAFAEGFVTVLMPLARQAALVRETLPDKRVISRLIHWTSTCNGKCWKFD